MEKFLAFSLRFSEETKLMTDEVKNQIDYLEAMRNSGAIAGWCTSVDEAIRIVMEVS